MSISNPDPALTVRDDGAAHPTALREGSVGVLGILFFVLSAQAPLTGIVGASPLATALGNGAGAPGAYLVVGLVIMVFSVGFVAMSRRIQANGAFYAYVTAAFGDRVGAGAGWLALLAYCTIQAAMYGLYGAAFSGLLASVGLPLPWWLLSVATMALVQILGSLNVELGARILAVLVGLEILILLAFGIGVLLSGGGPEGIDVGASFSPGAIASGAPGVAIMFAVASMFGFESTAIYSAEAKDPGRTVARATYLAVVVIAAFFSFISFMLVSYYGRPRSGRRPGLPSSLETQHRSSSARSWTCSGRGRVPRPGSCSSPHSSRASSPSTTASTATSTHWRSAGPCPLWCHAPTSTWLPLLPVVSRPLSR